MYRIGNDSKSGSGSDSDHVGKTFHAFPWVLFQFFRAASGVAGTHAPASQYCYFIFVRRRRVSQTATKPQEGGGRVVNAMSLPCTLVCAQLWSRPPSTPQETHRPIPQRAHDNMPVKYLQAAVELFGQILYGVGAVGHKHCAALGVRGHVLQSIKILIHQQQLHDLRMGCFQRAGPNRLVFLHRRSWYNRCPVPFLACGAGGGVGGTPRGGSSTCEQRDICPTLTD